MNTELFIAKRIVTRNKTNFSQPIVKIAIISIALGLTIMFLSIAVLTGFQIEIRNKLVGFGGHIQVSLFQPNQSIEPLPVSKNQAFLSKLQNIKGIRHIQVYATKAGMIQTGDQIQGVILKGVDSDFDWSFFRNKIISGRNFQVNDSGRTDEIIISKKLCDLLKLKLHDDLRTYFIAGEQVLGRKFNIVGIYETGLEEFDQLYILGDIHHIQRLNRWDPDQVGGFEIILSDFKDLDKLGNIVYKEIPFEMNASTIRHLYPQIFDWLKLQDMNVIIILILMVLVAAITMISTLLILILERTKMIGILKALGMRNTMIRKVFLYEAIYIIGWGLLWGNFIGFTLCMIQKHFGIITLSQESYYMTQVPVSLNALYILILNLSTLLICYVMLIFPSMIIVKIHPIRAIRFS